MNIHILFILFSFFSQNWSIDSLEDGECKIDSDCDMQHSVCLNSKCVCPGGFVVTGDMTQCLQGAAGYRAPCEDSVQCSYTLQTGGQCKSNTCTCSEGYHYLKGRCWKTSGLGGVCAHDENCFVNYDFESTSCNDSKKCQCADGYYQREYTSCRRKAGHGEPCGIALDCQFEDAVCSVDRKCVFKNETKLSTVLKQKITKRVFKDEKKKENEVFKLLGKTVGDKCLNDSDCTDIANAVCDKAGQCSCQPGFYSAGNKTICYAEVGSKCSKDSECVGKNMMCRKEKGWCTCKAGFITSEDNRFCDKLSRYLMWSCLTDKWCSLFGPEGVCINKKCHCSSTSHYVEKEFYCWKTNKVGESCQQNFDCGENKDIEPCENGKCSCVSDYHPSSDSMTCRKDSKSPGNPCSENQDCVYPHGSCNATVCTCSKGYLPSTDRCLIGIGGDCNDTEKCSVEGSSCQDGKCRCRSDLVVSADDSRCLTSANQYNDPCEESQQCTKLLGEGSGCEGGSCVCRRGYHFYSAGYPCFRSVALGQRCHREAECTYNLHTACLGGSCRCSYGYKTFNHTCISGAAQLVVSKLLIVILLPLLFMKNYLF